MVPAADWVAAHVAADVPELTDVAARVAAMQNLLYVTQGGVWNPGCYFGSPLE